MVEFFEKLFDTSDFPARWYCGNWSEGHGWLHIISDTAIWGAYMAIPATLTYFILKRKDIPFLPVFWLFAAFIFSCGTTHLLDAGIFWWPSYRLSGIVKLITAIVSWATVFALIPVIPKALSLPGLGAVNAELNKALEAITKSEERLRKVIESVPNGIVIVNDKGKIVLTNPVCNTIFGYEQGELVGQDIEVLVPAHLHGPHPAYRDAFLAAPETRPMGRGRDLYGQCKDGTEIPVEIGLNPIESDEGTLVLATIVDITERKKAEETLARYTAELERSNQELDEYAYVASHDLRTPLEGIQSLAGWVQEDAAALLPEASQRHLQQIQQRASRLKVLLDDLLAYSRAGRLETTLDPVNVHELVEEVVNSLHPPKEFNFHIQDDLPQLTTAETPLRRVFLNLIGNAIKHHDREDGAITVSCETSPTHYVFRIADDGPGIAPDFHDKIFMLFETLKPRDKVEGSGMGLAIVKKLLGACGGTIQVTSTIGEGTTFEFTWPIDSRV